MMFIMFILLTILLSLLALIAITVFYLNLYYMFAYHTFSISCVGNCILSILLMIAVNYGFHLNTYDFKTKIIREEYQQLLIEDEYSPVFNDKYSADLIAFYDLFIAKTALSNEDKERIFNQYKDLEFNRFVKVTTFETLQKSTYKPLYLIINKDNDAIKEFLANINLVTAINFLENKIQFTIEKKVLKTHCKCGKCYKVCTSFFELVY